MRFKFFKYILGCVDHALQDFTSISAMKENGWVFDVTNSSDKNYASQCGSSPLHGYSYGSDVGSFQVAFIASGNATLNYGNCNRTGIVSVLLNGYEISQVAGNTRERKITFEYTSRNILTIKETGSGIIKLNSLKLSC